jgi:hypothetical protein
VDAFEILDNDDHRWLPYHLLQKFKETVGASFYQNEFKEIQRLVLQEDDLTRSSILFHDPDAEKRLAKKIFVRIYNGTETPILTLEHLHEVKKGLVAIDLSYPDKLANLRNDYTKDDPTTFSHLFPFSERRVPRATPLWNVPKYSGIFALIQTY